MFKEYVKRFSICILGLALYAFGNFLGVKAGSAGTNAWISLSLGVSGMSGMSFGTANLVISIFIILIDLLGKGKLGFGTILNATLISVFSDMFINIFSFIPDGTNPVLGAVVSLLGQTVISFATVLYMLPALGAGPRDTLMVIIGKNFPKAPIGAVKLCIELAVLLIGVLLGAPLGLGTVLVLVLQASIFQLVCRICRFEPRSVVQEDIIDTVKRIVKK